jgi:hypothetical protein
VVGAVAAALLVSPVGAAGTLTKANVKKIARKVFNQRAVSLKDACPAGTSPMAGGCMETSARAAADWFDASQACFDAGRRLPTPSELWGFQGAGNDLDGDGVQGEGTSALDITDTGDTTWWGIRDDNTFWVHLTTFARPFRCVGPMTNA